jgi:DnaK suppressor protein
MTTELTPPQGTTWTTEELTAVRAELAHTVDRLNAELQIIDSTLSVAASGSTLDILHDELDVASQRADLLQSSVQAENAEAILAQLEHVLSRLDAGLYGVCESCSGAIARPRLEAFPRATLCMGCVH